jgi:hypothetical protein
LGEYSDTAGPGLDIAARDIRDCLARGKSVRYLLVPEVESYIHDMDYTEYNMDNDAVMKIIKGRLSARRYEHSLQVAGEARQMAVKFGPILARLISQD